MQKLHRRSFVVECLVCCRSAIGNDWPLQHQLHRGNNNFVKYDCGRVLFCTALVDGQEFSGLLPRSGRDYHSGKQAATCDDDDPCIVKNTSR